MSKNWNTSNQIPSENYLNQPNIFGWDSPLPIQTSLNRTFISRNKNDTKHTSVSVDGCYEKSFFCQHMQTRYTAYQFDINTYFEYESFDCIFLLSTLSDTYKLKAFFFLIIESIFLQLNVYLRNLLFDNNAKWCFPWKILYVCCDFCKSFLISPSYVLKLIVLRILMCVYKC